MKEGLSPMYDGVQNNRANWQNLADEYEHKKTGKNNKG